MPHTQPPHVQELGRRNYDQEVLELRKQLDEVKEQNIELDHKMEILTHSVESLTANVAGLVDAWNTAKGITAFVKWLSGVVLSCGVVWALLKGGIKL